MYNNPYMYTRFTPNMSMGMNTLRGVSSSVPIGMNAVRGASTAIPNMGMNITRGAASSGVFSRLGGMFSSLRSFNWGGLINNASKTIGIINQTIPLVKQVGPMVHNMRSVMKIASIFKDETDPVSANSFSNKENLEENKKENTISSSNRLENQRSDSDYDNSNSPVFFVN